MIRYLYHFMMIGLGHRPYRVISLRIYRESPRRIRVDFQVAPKWWANDRERKVMSGLAVGDLRRAVGVRGEIFEITTVDDT